MRRRSSGRSASSGCPGGDDHRHPLQIELLEGEPDHLVGVGEPAHHHVELTALEALEQDAVRAGDQVNGGVAALGGQLVHRLRYQADGDGRQRADADVGVALELALGDAVDRVLQGDEAGRRMVLERLAERRQREPFGPAREQANVEQLLELAQGLGDGGLRHRQLIGGAADMTQPSDLHEALEMTDLHARVDHAGLPLPSCCGDYLTVIACRQVLISNRPPRSAKVHLPVDSAGGEGGQVRWRSNASATSSCTMRRPARPTRRCWSW